MADFAPAIAITLANEGSAYVPNDNGHGPSKYGITLETYQVYMPDATPETIMALMEAEALDWYCTCVWSRYNIGDITDQNLANKVLDLVVNMGPVALKLLQEAVNSVDPADTPLTVDGILGPWTIELVNATDPVKLLAEYKTLAAQLYREIAANNPAEAGDLAGWLKRLDA